jgi:NifB/MoaA-like Fe-S oxidoreductase
VAGLITAEDITYQLKNESLGRYIVIPECMLRKGYEFSDSKDRVFLDDVTLEKLEKTLKRKILVCDYTGKDLIKIINENGEVK